MDAIKLLLDTICDNQLVSVNESQKVQFEHAIQEAYEQQKFLIMEAYQEGYDAAFHHEPSDAEKYYIETVTQWQKESIDNDNRHLTELPNLDNEIWKALKLIKTYSSNPEDHIKPIRDLFLKLREDHTNYGQDTPLGKQNYDQEKRYFDPK